MKKILIAASVALCFASSSFAVEKAGSTSTITSTLTSTIGTLTAPVVVGGVAALTVLAGMNSNVKGTITPVIVIDDPADPDPTCNGSDPLVDGVCTGTTTTVTVTGTGTTTSTLTVPVTFTYAPTL
jgi:hypothetical protein